MNLLEETEIKTDSKTALQNFVIPYLDFYMDLACAW